jgi:hypothetical protein
MREAGAGRVRQNRRSKRFDEGDAMFARVARYEVPPDRIDDAVQAFEQAVDTIAGLDGFERGLVLIEEDTGMTLTVTLWNNGSSLENSETRAALARRTAVKSVDGFVHSVERFNVAVDASPAPSKQAAGA